MAEFTTGAVQSASPFRPQGAATNPAAVPLVNAFSSMASNAISGLAGAGRGKQLEQAAQYTQGFREDQLLIADAVEQGVMTAQQGTSRFRQNLLKYTSGNPLLGEELTKIHKDIVATSGLGLEVVQGSAEDQAFEQVRTKAITEGFVPTGASPDEITAGVALYQEDQAIQAQMKRTQAEATLTSTNLSIESGRGNLARNRMQWESQDALASLASTRTPVFRNQMNQIVQDLESGAITQEEAIQLADDQLLTVNTFLSQVGKDAGSDYVNNLASPIRNIHTNTMKHLNGELSAELLERSNTAALATATAGWTADPERARVIAGSRLFPNSDLLTFSQKTMTSISSYLSGYSSDKGLANPFPTDEVSKEGFSNYTTGVLKPNINLMLGGDLSDEGVNELNTNIGNMIRSIPAYSGTAEGLGDYRGLVDFLADPNTFGRYVEKVGGIPSDAIDNAKLILQENYETKVVDLIQKEFRQQVARIPRIAPATGNVSAGAIGAMTVENNQVPSVIEPTFAGGGVSFRIRPGVENNVEYRRIVRNLNERVSPALNKLIHLGAHFNGGRDYKGTYDANYSDIFGGEQTPTE